MEATILETAEPSVVTPPVTTRDVLHRAAYLFEEALVEWAQAPNVETSEGRYCIMAAVARAEGQLGEAYYPSDDLVLALGFRSTYHAWVWNDEKCRTKEEVVARLREAAEAAS